MRRTVELFRQETDDMGGCTLWLRDRIEPVGTLDTVNVHHDPMVGGLPDRSWRVFTARVKPPGNALHHLVNLVADHPTVDDSLVLVEVVEDVSQLDEPSDWNHSSIES